MRWTRGVVLPLACTLLLTAGCGGEPATRAPVPEPRSPVPTGTATPTTVATPVATLSPTATATPTPTPAPTTTPSPTATTSPTPSATPSPAEYTPLTMGEPRPLPAGSTLYFREAGSCHGPVWWTRAIATGAGELVWDNPFAKLPPINTDNRGLDNWGPQLAHVSASGQTLVARVCERGACMAFDRVDENAVEALWGSTDAGETWERWGDDPEGGIWDGSETDVAFRDAEGRLKGLRSGEEWTPPEREDRRSPRASGWGDGWKATSRLASRVWSKVDDRLGDDEREPGQLDLFLHFSDPDAVPGAYSWGGEGSYESHRPLRLVDHLEGELFVGFLGSQACGDVTKTVLVDFSSGTVHMVPGLEPGVDLYTARLTEPPTPPSATPIRATEPRPRPFVRQPAAYDTPPGAYTAITIGAFHACALTEEGEAVCWDLDGGHAWDTPPGSYTFIASEHDTTCAITDEGGIVCWPREGAPASAGWQDPSRDAPPGRYRKVSWTGAYACALTQAGAAVCWGPRVRWLSPPVLPAGIYTTISLSYDTLEDESGFIGGILKACATSDGGDIACWRLERTNAGDVEEAVDVRQGGYVDAQVAPWSWGATCALTANGEATCGRWASDPSTRYTALAVGDRFVCAVTGDGRVECANHGLRYEIFGEGGEVELMRPPVPEPGRRYTSVSVRDSTACALTESGEADCWGTTANLVAYPDPPPGGYVAVSDGYGHTCALTADGQVTCWGWNNFGQADVPEGRYTAVSAGFASTCALNEAGEVVCWGRFPWGEPWTVSSQGQYRAISTGYDGGCVLTVQGELACEGWDLGGFPEPPATSFAAITVSWTGHACALTEDGEAFCWGGNVHGEVDVPPSTWTAIDAGDRQTCGIDDAGRASCWGTRSGQLPDAPTGHYVAVGTNGYDVCLLTDAGQVYCRNEEDWESGTPLRRLDVDARVLQVSVGKHRTCALTEAGLLTCWGDTEYWRSQPYLNRYGYQLGR